MSLSSSDKVEKEFAELMRQTDPEDWHIKAVFAADREGDSRRLLLMWARYEDYRDTQPWFRFAVTAKYADEDDLDPWGGIVRTGGVEVLHHADAHKPALARAVQLLTLSVFERLAAIEPCPDATDV